jgi:hypothetical protein
MSTNKDTYRGRLRATGFLAALAGFCLLAGCQFPTTVYGRLTLKPGEDGDVRLSRVELHDSVAWDSSPVYALVPEPGGQSFRASFEFPAVEPGSYYLLAWQDRDSDGKVSDGDLTGVCGGRHQPGSPGSPVIVPEGWTVDVSDIEMATYTMLEVTAAGDRSAAGDTTTFTYSFNHDVVMSSLVITLPGQPAIPDPGAPGPKFADSTYRSEGLSMGGPMPTGLHQLEFRGVFGDSAFDIRKAVLVE